MVTSKQFDLLNRLTNSSSSVSFVYAYNSADQRTRATLADGSYWVYAYDSLGQVVLGKRYWSDGTAVAGQQFEYTFDDIGNRKTAGSGGDHDQYGGALHYGNYLANSLNQYTSRDVPGYVNVIGSAKTNATVSLWTPDGYWAQTSRKADYFRGELPLNNTTGALWLTITNLAVLNNGTNADIATNTVGNAFVRRTPEAFGYDADGNLTADGRFTITWDAENRALSFGSLISGPSGSKIKVDCAYDWLGRRTQKIVSTWNGSAFVPQSTNRFVYDGWNLIAILNATNGLLRSLIWGLDLSASPQGAGGVGGLLAISDSTQGTHFVAFDGNGNVSALIKASDATISGQYEYGPFGELLRATGPMAKANPLRFSTKYQDDETDLLYYGYRFYNQSTGRWLSRDPAGESGGENEIAAFGNNPISAFDVLGLLRSGEDLDVSYKGSKVGSLHVAYYSRLPFDDDVTERTFFGAQLRIDPHMDDCSCNCCYKWRQHFSTQWDDQYAPAPPREDKWKYLPPNITEMKDILDIDYAVPRVADWYARSSDDSGFCSYPFRDNPGQYPPFRMFHPDPGSDPVKKIKKATITFKLEFVRLTNCDLPTGGDTLLTLNWGFWYTKREHGLLNNN